MGRYWGQCRELGSYWNYAGQKYARFDSRQSLWAAGNRQWYSHAVPMRNCPNGQALPERQAKQQISGISLRPKNHPVKFKFVRRRKVPTASSAW